MEPDVSPDGKLVAYVSDRSGESHFDLWVQPAGGGEARRLTQTPGDKRYPRFSPDGRLIAYYVEGASSPGIYTIPTLGGEPRKLVEGGAYPRFSPDGAYIACLLGVNAKSGVGRTIAVIPAAGGRLREIPTGWPWVSSPLWSPDGSHLLFHGISTRYPARWAAGWYVVPAGGGKPEAVDVEATMRKAGIELAPGSVPDPSCWYRRRVLFGATIGDSRNLWTISLSPSTYCVEGSPRRLTFGTETEEGDASVGGDGVVAFGSYTTERHLYRLPLKPPVSGGQRGVERLTSRRGNYHGLSISGDRQKLLYMEGFGRRQRIILRELASGSETDLPFLASEDLLAAPVLSPDGTRVAYGHRIRRGSGKEVLEAVVRGVDGGREEPLCQECTPQMWLPDGRHLVTQPVVGPSDPARFSPRLVDLASKQVSRLDAPAGHALSILSFSPDGRWAAVRLTPLPFGTVGDEIFLCPVRQDNLAPLTEWIPVPSRTALSEVRWSADGSSLYFFSRSSEDHSLDVLLLNPATKGIRGAMQALYRLDKPNFQALEWSGLAAAAESLIFSGLESKGNIWLLKLAR